MVLLVLTACGGNGGAEASSASDGGESTGGGEASSEGGLSGEVTVFAAASLTEAFTQIGKDFEAAHPGARVRFNFAGSSTLAQQLIRGAPAGAFASANPDQMQNVVEAGLVTGEPTIFVRNKLQIVVPEGNPTNVTGLADFGKEELALAICAEEVPCGAAAQQAFEVAGVTPAPDTLEQDVKAVLTKVSLGEADAGLVYGTDVASAEGDVEGISFPEADRAINDYPIAVLDDAPNAEVAQAFVDYVLASQGQQVLADFGFTTTAS